MKKISIAAGFPHACGGACRGETEQDQDGRRLRRGTPHHYQLSTTTKKGKAKVYDSVGDRDLQGEVGHRVEARGAVSGQNLKVSTMKSSLARTVIDAIVKNRSAVQEPFS